VSQVSEQQLEIDHLDVFRRVDSTLDVYCVRVLEGAHHVTERIAVARLLGARLGLRLRLRVRARVEGQGQGIAVARRPKKLVAEPLAAAGALG
jgi:hypothetical protein